MADFLWAGTKTSRPGPLGLVDRILTETLMAWDHRGLLATCFLRGHPDVGSPTLRIGRVILVF
jgi:hypothetical protein